MPHWLKKLIARVVGPLGAGRCIDCNSRMTPDELRYYHAQCERCLEDDMAWMERELAKDLRVSQDTEARQ